MKFDCELGWFKMHDIQFNNINTVPIWWVKWKMILMNYKFLTLSYVSRFNNEFRKSKSRNM
jgi:hypothetical protein